MDVDSSVSLHHTPPAAGTEVRLLASQFCSLAEQRHGSLHGPKARSSTKLADDLLAKNVGIARVTLQTGLSATP